jgi:hypothetical protein
VSIHHELARVEPVLSLPSVGTSLSIPSALAPSVLMSFKRWYWERIPLRMTAHVDKFAQLKDMLNEKTVLQQL